MKKFASLMLTLMLIISMLAVGVTSASAAVGIDFSKKGTITLTKKDPETQQPVSGAGFTAYKVMALSQSGEQSTAANTTDYGTYVVESAFQNIITDEQFIKITGDETSEGGLYKNTDELEALVSRLEVAAPNATYSKAFTEGQNGTYVASDLDLGVYLVIETVVPETGDDKSTYMKSSQSFLITIPEYQNEDNTWKYEVSASPKDKKLTIDKKTEDYNNSTDNAKAWVDENDYSIGDKVPFQVKSQVPNYGMSRNYPDDSNYNEKVTYHIDKHDANGVVEYVKNADGSYKLDNNGLKIPVFDSESYNQIVYVFTDEFSDGLTYNNDLVVTFTQGNETKELVALSEGKTLKSVDADKKLSGDADYKVTVDGQKLTIQIAWAALDGFEEDGTLSKTNMGFQGADIELTYSATLNEKAVVKTANPNKVKLTFSTDPENDVIDPETGKPVVDEIEDETDIFTYELELEKLFDGHSVGQYNNVDASDVKFTLTRIANDNGDAINEVLKFAKDGDNYVLAQEGETTEFSLKADGLVSVKGLESGTYRLEETATVNGYSKLTTPIEFKLVSKFDSDGHMIAGLDRDADKLQSGTTSLYYTRTDNGAVATLLPAGTDAENSGLFQFTVNNVKKQFDLPTTGGLGIWMFTIAGGIVMAGAIIFFTVIRKKSNKEVR